MKKYVAEFTGTFTLVFCGTGAIVINDISGGAVTHVGVAITFGLIVMAMIYTFGDLSGAHINPAVTIAFAVHKTFPFKEVPPYIISQLLGGIAASIVLKLLFPASTNLGATIPSGSSVQSFVLEFLLSFFLMLTILRVARGSKEKGLFAGIAIGSVVLLEALFAGPICGASMNPARSIAPALVSGHFNFLWFYIIAPIGGMLSSVFVQHYLET
ncbi:MAG: aquaporin [Chitinophagaceae bacterium]